MKNVSFLSKFFALFCVQYEFYSFSLLNVDILLLKKFHILFSAGTQFFGCLDKEKTSGERPSIFCLDAI